MTQYTEQQPLKTTGKLRTQYCVRSMTLQRVLTDYYTTKQVSINAAYKRRKWHLTLQSILPCSSKTFS